MPAGEPLPLSAVMAFLPCDALAAAAKFNREWAEATATPPATAHWREYTISEFGLAVSNAETDNGVYDGSDWARA